MYCFLRGHAGHFFGVFLLVIRIKYSFLFFQQKLYYSGIYSLTVKTAFLPNRTYVGASLINTLRARLTVPKRDCEVPDIFEAQFVKKNAFFIVGKSWDRFHC